VPGLADAVEIVGGGAHTCARRAGGSVVCWGYNYLGQLGVGSTRPTSSNRPLAVRGLSDAVQLAAGRYHTCARRQTGAVACWGLNRKGELGDGGTTDRPSPGRVGSITDAQFLAAGRWHFCVIRRNATGVVLGRQPRRPARHRRRQRHRQPAPGRGQEPAKGMTGAG